MLIYLDQNYASRIAKFLLGQAGNEHFGLLYEALKNSDALIPPSPFHVLELRGGYLLPIFKTLFTQFSKGYWVRPWLEVFKRQLASKSISSDDLLWRGGNWEQSAELTPLQSIVELELYGSFLERSWQARKTLYKLLNYESQAPQPPFIQLLARLLAFRSLEPERYARPSDLADLLMAATIAPYVDVLATDRYMREMLKRIGHRGLVYSGRRHEVLGLAALLKGK